MNMSLVGGLIVGGVLGVIAGVVVMWLKQKKGLQPIAPKTVAVTVITTSPGVNQEDVLLNPGDSIQWTEVSAVKTFNVAFQGRSPFSAGQFSPPQGSSSVSSGGANVNPGSGQAQCFKYSIAVTTSSGTTSFDPHVIIMGN